MLNKSEQAYASARLICKNMCFLLKSSFYNKMNNYLVQNFKNAILDQKTTLSKLVSKEEWYDALFKLKQACSSKLYLK